MKLGVFSVYDAAVKAYLPPFFARAPGEAQRMFRDAIRDPKSQFAPHVEDYTLFQLGEFDDMSGDLAPMAPAPAKIVTGQQAAADA